jgi:predicted membrane channel-forming protein YqfA (hemolysin III family)
MFLGVCLISTLLAVPFCKWVLRKSYAVYLILLYITFSVLSVLVELQVINLTDI